MCPVPILRPKADPCGKSLAFVSPGIAKFPHYFFLSARYRFDPCSHAHVRKSSHWKQTVESCLIEQAGRSATSVIGDGGQCAMSSLGLADLENNISSSPKKTPIKPPEREKKPPRKEPPPPPNPGEPGLADRPPVGDPPQRRGPKKLAAAETGDQFSAAINSSLLLPRGRVWFQRCDYSCG